MFRATDCFRAALEEVLEKRKKTLKQKDLAKSVGIQPSSLSDYKRGWTKAKDKDGKEAIKEKNLGEDVRERIAEEVGLGCPEMLIRGRDILNPTFESDADEVEMIYMIQRFERLMAEQTKALQAVVAGISALQEEMSDLKKEWPPLGQPGGPRAGGKK